MLGLQRNGAYVQLMVQWGRLLWVEGEQSRQNCIYCTHTHKKRKITINSLNMVKTLWKVCLGFAPSGWVLPQECLCCLCQYLLMKSLLKGGGGVFALYVTFFEWRIWFQFTTALWLNKGLDNCAVREEEMEVDHMCSQHVQEMTTVARPSRLTVTLSITVNDQGRSPTRFFRLHLYTDTWQVMGPVQWHVGIADTKKCCCFFTII